MTLSDLIAAARKDLAVWTALPARYKVTASSRGVVDEIAAATVPQGTSCILAILSETPKLALCRPEEWAYEGSPSVHDLGLSVIREHIATVLWAEYEKEKAT